jgi:NADPH:quinone reductase-like Zn-dependent oxidoreductase
MKAVAYRTPGPIDRQDALQDITVETPNAQGRDLLVKINAVSVNPVDTKLRLGAAPNGGGWRVLGFDAAGVVEAIGSEVLNFTPGDAVFYAGSIARPGTNSEYHLVDERIVGRKPATLSDAEAAALPLTAITAWEMLFDRLAVTRPTPEESRYTNCPSTRLLARVLVVRMEMLPLGHAFSHRVQAVQLCSPSSSWGITTWPRKRSGKARVSRFSGYSRVTMRWGLRI